MNIYNLKQNFNSLILKLEQLEQIQQLDYLIEFDDIIENFKYTLPDFNTNDIKDREYYNVNKNIYNKILPLCLLYYTSNIDRIEKIK